MPLSTHPDRRLPRSQSPAAGWPVSPRDALWRRPVFACRCLSDALIWAGVLPRISIPAPAKLSTIASMCCSAAAPICWILPASGVQDKIRWYEKLTFLEPGGRASVIGPSALPAPLHTAWAFLRADCLNFRDKLGISRAMAALAPWAPADLGESFLDWLNTTDKPDKRSSASGRQFWSAL
jgi:hypothetical protein